LLCRSVKKMRIISVWQVQQRRKTHQFYALENLVDLTFWSILWAEYLSFHGKIDWAIQMVRHVIQTIWLVYRTCCLQNYTRAQQWRTRDWMVLFSFIVNIRIESNVVLYTRMSLDVYMHMIYSRWSRSWCRTKTRIRML